MAHDRSVPLHDGRHPYYATEGNYFKNGLHERFDSWAEFITGGMYDSDPDLNLLYRWDWERRAPTCPRCEGDGFNGGVECSRCEGYGEIRNVEAAHYLKLYWVLQRKAIHQSSEVRVTLQDEESVREWLTERAKTIAAIWHPIVPELDPSMLSDRDA